MSSEGEQQTRDIKNHLLFEIATEVAHRGQSRLVSSRLAILTNRPSVLSPSHANLILDQLVVSTLSSSPRPPSQQLNMASDTLSSALLTTNR